MWRRSRSNGISLCRLGCNLSKIRNREIELNSRLRTCSIPRYKLFPRISSVFQVLGLHLHQQRIASRLNPTFSQSGAVSYIVPPATTFSTVLKTDATVTP